MTDKFDPTTNRVPFELLTDEEQEALRGWSYGIEYHKRKQWRETDHPVWHYETVYRGKPAPVVTSKWINVYPDNHSYKHNSRVAADSNASSQRIAVLRIDTCNGVSTAHLEEV
jgi:hypothetical protein